MQMQNGSTVEARNRRGCGMESLLSPFKPVKVLRSCHEFGRFQVGLVWTRYALLRSKAAVLVKIDQAR